MSESNKPFTVKDRRHFTPEGEVREDPEVPAGSAEEVARPSPEPRESPERPGPEAAAASQTIGERADGAETSGSTSSAPRPGSPGAQDAGPADFGQFVLSLGAQAGMLLSGQGLPEGADAGETLAGARSIISILEMLKEKTEGRRTSHEDEILEGLLFELRMAYVEASRAGGS